MHEDFSFMKEKIKDKPFYKKRWVQITFATVILAVLFGTIGGFAFAKVHGWLEKKQEQEAMTNIQIPEDLSEETTSGESVGNETTKPETIMVENLFTLEDYGVLYAQLRGIANEAKKAIVTVTAVSNDVDWFNEAYENLGQSAGMIIGDNGVELLVLTEYDKVAS